ncbi:MAG: tRNA (adenosine(37)-N6)-threonylcarbamoyltransferase complex transferase subunit TsaD [Candidatus Omnitrophota bacterium]
MITLGIETSCDETSVAVLKDGREILSNVIFSSLKEHKAFGGVVPEIASRAQLETVLACLDVAMKKARVTLENLDLIAVTQGPGLMGSLLVGLSAAKALAFSLKKPLVGVDHVIAHAYSGFLSDPSIRFPCLGLVISGGHTLLVKMTSPSRVKILGRTIDDAAGEAFDKVAKILGLGYPGGPEIDRLSRGQDTNRSYFTRPFLSNDSLNFSFSGIKTAVFYKVEKLKKKKLLTNSAKKAVCAGFQEAVCDVLVKKSLRAAKAHGLGTLVVGGGVSANSRLREKLKKAAAGEGITVVFPPLAFCQDNAAMIAGLGTALYEEGRRDTLDLSSYPDFSKYHLNDAHSTKEVPDAR